jgi:hypothetical protein
MDTQDITFPTGTVLNGKWVILELLGKGGMGEVYHAHQLNLKRNVAIKVHLHPNTWLWEDRFPVFKKAP